MERKDIKRNKLMRTWFRYRKVFAAVLAALVLVVILGTLIGKIGKSNSTVATNTTTEAPTEMPTEAPTILAEVPTEPITEPVTESQKAGARPVATEDFVNQAFYENAVVFGDTFVAGLESSDLINTKKVIADINWTVGKAESKGVSKITAAAPDKVIIELGINDFNYDGRTAQRIYDDFTSLVAAINKAVPSAKIYLVSVFPVSSGFESKSSIYIENSKVREVNGMLAAMEGVTYIDLYDALSDGKGYLNTDLSTDGLHIKKAYYPYILNSIAELAQAQ